MALRTLSCAAIIVRPRAVSRKLCDRGPSNRPISTMVIAITTSSSTSVKPRRTLVMTFSGPPVAADEGVEVQLAPADRRLDALGGQPARGAFDPDHAGADADSPDPGDAHRAGHCVSPGGAVDPDPPVRVLVDIP